MTLMQELIDINLTYANTIIDVFEHFDEKKD